MEYERVKILEKIALKSQRGIKPNTFGESMYASLSTFKCDVRKQISLTQEKLGLEYKPLLVCDLGCAYGVAVAQLNMTSGVEAFGVDQFLYPSVDRPTGYGCEIDELLLKTIQNDYGLSLSMFKKERHIVTKIEKMKSIPTNSFDFLISSFALIHLDNKAIKKAIKEIDRVLVPNGGAVLEIKEDHICLFRKLNRMVDRHDSDTIIISSTSLESRAVRSA